MNPDLIAEEAIPCGMVIVNNFTGEQDAENCEGSVDKDPSGIDFNQSNESNVIIKGEPFSIDESTFQNEDSSHQVLINEPNESAALMEVYIKQEPPSPPPEQDFDFDANGGLDVVAGHQEASPDKQFTPENQVRIKEEPFPSDEDYLDVREQPVTLVRNFVAEDCEPSTSCKRYIKEVQFSQSVNGLSYGVNRKMISEDRLAEEAKVAHENLFELNEGHDSSYSDSFFNREPVSLDNAYTFDENEPMKSQETSFNEQPSTSSGHFLNHDVNEQITTSLSNEQNHFILNEQEFAHRDMLPIEDQVPLDEHLTSEEDEPITTNETVTIGEPSTSTDEILTFDINDQMIADMAETSSEEDKGMFDEGSEASVSEPTTSDEEYCPPGGDKGKTDQSEIDSLAEENIHIQTTPDGQKLFVCKICYFQAEHRSKVKLHMKSHQEQKAFKCFLCDYNSLDKDRLRNHIKLAHKDSKVDPMVFEEDPQTYMYNFLNLYMKQQIDNVSCDRFFVCEICTYRSKRKYHVQRHMLKHMCAQIGDLEKEEDKEKAYACTQCEFKTQDIKEFLNHINTHKMRKNVMLSCEFCHFKTSCKTILKEHNKSHNIVSVENPFTCERCQAQFKRMKDWIYHLKTHKSEKIYKCERCDFKTAYKNSLRKHEKTLCAIKEACTLYRCHMCSYKSEYSEHVKRHMRCHFRPDELTTSKREVTPNDGYVCSVCDFNTMEIQVFLHHIKEHEPGKKNVREKKNQRFQCGVCNFETLYMKVFLRHKKLHEN